jgi:DNA-binding winged helix-turn-helix (wHTH) protein
MSGPADNSGLAPAKDLRPFRVAAGVVADPLRHRIVRGGRDIAVEPRVMELLVYFARRPGAVISKEELRENIWGAHVVDEAVHRAVSLLRTALGDSSRDSNILETVRHHGYRLMVAPREERRGGFLRTWAAPALAGLAAVLIMLLSIARPGAGGTGPGGSSPATAAAPAAVARPAAAPPIAIAEASPLLSLAGAGQSPVRARAFRLRPDRAHRASSAERVPDRAFKPGPVQTAERPVARFPEATPAPTPTAFAPRAQGYWARAPEPAPAPPAQ